MLMRYWCNLAKSSYFSDGSHGGVRNTDLNVLIQVIKKVNSDNANKVGGSVPVCLSVQLSIHWLINNMNASVQHSRSALRHRRCRNRSCAQSRQWAVGPSVVSKWVGNTCSHHQAETKQASSDDDDDDDGRRDAARIAPDSGESLN